MYDIVILLPTMNRDKSIKEYITKCIDVCVEYNICIYIYDTSSDNKTELFVSDLKERNEKYRDLIIYYKNNCYPGKTSDLKVVEGLQKLCTLAKYIWLSGDGNIPNIEEVIEFIQDGISQTNDIIQLVMEKDKSLYCIENYSSAQEYFKTYGWRATSYGSTLISTKNIDFTLLKSQYGKLTNSGFVYWSYLFCVLDRLPSPAIYVIHADFYTKNIHKTTNTSYGSGKFVLFWVDNWIKAINCLPVSYKEYESQVAKDIGINLKLYSHQNLMLLRGTGNISSEIYTKYKEKFQLVTDVPLRRIYFYSRFPKIIALIYVKTRYFGANLLRRIKRTREKR